MKLEIAVESGARIIGINNRDLKTFKVDPQNHRTLRPLIPPDRIVVSESGIKPQRYGEDCKVGVNAALVGESLMALRNIAAKMREICDQGQNMRADRYRISFSRSRSRRRFPGAGLCSQPPQVSPEKAARIVAEVRSLNLTRQWSGYLSTRRPGGEPDCRYCGSGLGAAQRQ